MIEHSKSIDLGDIIFNYQTLGDGDKKLIAFHGFGQNGGAYMPLSEPDFGFTVYAFDLPFHGGTRLNTDLNHISVDIIFTLVEKLIQIESLKTFSLVGFSIGAKYCIPINEKYFDSVENCWLLAPDGLVVNSWYKMATYNKATLRIFRFTLDNPKVVNVLGKIVVNIRILNPLVLQFVMRSLDTKEKRDQVYKTWQIMRKLNWKVEELKCKINTQGSKVKVVLVEQDRVINNSKIIKLIKSFENVKLIQISGAHQTAIQSLAQNKTLF